MFAGTGQVSRRNRTAYTGGYDTRHRFHITAVEFFYGRTNIGFFKRQMYMHRACKILFSRALYLCQDAVFYPLQHVPVWRNQGKRVAILFPPKGFNPGGELMLRQFLLEHIDT